MVGTPTGMFAAPHGGAIGMAGFIATPSAAGGYVPGVGPIRNNMGRNNVGGPMNSGGGFGASMPGPYARNDARGMRGGPPLVMGGRMGMMAGGVNGPEGGAGAMGPREAVAGRQLRSYEDLDADKGDAGIGELNY